jgi:hypothetical protein
MSTDPFSIVGAEPELSLACGAPGPIRRAEIEISMIAQRSAVLLAGSRAHSATSLAARNDVRINARNLMDFFCKKLVF